MTAAKGLETNAGEGRLARALLGMAGAALLLDAARRVEWANASARHLLAPVDPDGQSLTDLFRAGSGSSLDEVTAAFERDGAHAPIRVELADGRPLDCAVRPLGDGGFILNLDDASPHLQAAQAAQRDALTGLANRTALRERMAELLARARRSGAAIAVLCLDLDRFKSVNDTLGHPVGDALLCRVADRLRGVLREGDVVARMGGDEFAVIQAAPDQPKAAEGLARRLVDLIGRTYIVDGHMLNVGASVGVAMAPADGSDPDVLLKNADLALYRAKSDGRGVFRFFEPGMDARMQARRALETDLRKALALKQFALVYQPQIKLDTGAITGFEALLRWRHPERGLVSPADFIPLAEEIGLIVPIGDWVLRTACAEAAGWASPVGIAVNLSAAQFRGAKLVEAVASALARSGLQPSRLELEITESVLIEDTSVVLDALNELRGLGVRVSMDDFGTGYSSLSYLQKFPFDKIKIDQSFVRGMSQRADCRAIVRAVASLGASLGMRTIAEGVETPEQLAGIRAEGCSEVQGYLTGRPVPPEAAAALLIEAAAA